MTNVVKLKEDPTHKFATMREQELLFEMNGFLFRTTVDKIDEVLPNDIQRYCVNHVLYMLDQHRQMQWDNDTDMHLVHMNNTATIHGHRVEIDVKLEETEYPSYMCKGARGTSWDIHKDPNMGEETVKNINYNVNSRNIKDLTDCDG